jgi:hypothetical protein
MISELSSCNKHRYRRLAQVAVIRLGSFYVNCAEITKEPCLLCRSYDLLRVIFRQNNFILYPAEAQHNDRFMNQTDAKGHLWV